MTEDPYVDPYVEKALDIVARQVLSSLAQDVGDRWEDYPEIGEKDWERIVSKVLLLADSSPAAMDAMFGSVSKGWAMQFLADRAENFEKFEKEEA